MSTTYTEQQVRQHLPSGTERYAADVTQAINRRGLSRDTLESVVRQHGGSVYSFSSQIEAFLRNLGGTAGTTDGVETAGTYNVEAVRAALPSGFTMYADRVTEAINRYGLSRETLEGLVANLGGSPSRYAVAIDDFLGRITPSEDDVTEGSDEPGFDRQAAADVIRDFISAESTHIRNEERYGFSPEEVDALLILAGLEDEPEPEPEVEEAPEPGLLSRLISWARGQGFTG